jgi:hypothetical protein
MPPKYTPEDKLRRRREYYREWTARNPLYHAAYRIGWKKDQFDYEYRRPKRLPNGELPYEIKLTSCAPAEPHERFTGKSIYEKVQHPNRKMKRDD